MIRSDSANPRVFDARVVIGTKILSNFRAVGKKSVCWVKTIAIWRVFSSPTNHKTSLVLIIVFFRDQTTLRIVQRCTKHVQVSEPFYRLLAVCNVPYRNVRVYGGCLGFKKR